MLTREEIAEELVPYLPYKVSLPPEALEKLRVYLELLLRWNERISLTAIRDPRRMVRELFGESLFASQWIPMQGNLVDVGSGAGFPGLALKIAAPHLEVFLVESNGRKAAFMKELIRACSFSGVCVVNRRLEEWSRHGSDGVVVDIITTRAVKMDNSVFQYFLRFVKAGGLIVVFTTFNIAERIVATEASWEWQRLVPLPITLKRLLLIGNRKPGSVV